jgi:hypothetical protein
LTAKTVPYPALPPSEVVPYRVFPSAAIVKPAYGLAPLLFVETPKELVVPS